VLGLVSASARDDLMAAYSELARTATFAPTQLVAVIDGGVTGTPIVSRATLTLVPLPERLAVIRREVEWAGDGERGCGPQPLAFPG
jgi:hypothetical protein